MNIKDLGIDRLSLEDRISLALEIWERLGPNRPSNPLATAQRTELELD